MKRSRSKDEAVRPKLAKVAEEMKEWAAMLASEIAMWPAVRSQPMFGLISFYRKDKIFAALPKTRALVSPYSIIIKFHTESTHTRAVRHQLQEYPAMKWLSFELHSPDDVSAALRYLDLAYRAAK